MEGGTELLGLTIGTAEFTQRLPGVRENLRVSHREVCLSHRDSWVSHRASEFPTGKYGFQLETPRCRREPRVFTQEGTAFTQRLSGVRESLGVSHREVRSSHGDFLMSARALGFHTGKYGFHTETVRCRTVPRGLTQGSTAFNRRPSGVREKSQGLTQGIMAFKQRLSGVSQSLWSSHSEFTAIFVVQTA